MYRCWSFICHSDKDHGGTDQDFLKMVAHSSGQLKDGAFNRYWFGVVSFKWKGFSPGISEQSCGLSSYLFLYMKNPCVVIHGR